DYIVSSITLLPPTLQDGPEGAFWSGRPLKRMRRIPTVVSISGPPHLRETTVLDSSGRIVEGFLQKKGSPSQIPLGSDMHIPAEMGMIHGPETSYPFAV